MSKTVKEIYESRQEAFVVVFDRTLSVSQNVEWNLKQAFETKNNEVARCLISLFDTVPPVEKVTIRNKFVNFTMFCADLSVEELKNTKEFAKYTDARDFVKNAKLTTLVLFSVETIEAAYTKEEAKVIEVIEEIKEVEIKEETKETIYHNKNSDWYLINDNYKDTETIEEEGIDLTQYKIIKIESSETGNNEVDDDFWVWEAEDGVWFLEEEGCFERFESLEKLIKQYEFEKDLREEEVEYYDFNKNVDYDEFI